MPHEPVATVLVACPRPDQLGRFPALEGHAVIISAALVRGGQLSSTAVFRLGREEVTRDLPHVHPQTLRHLDVRGIARPGASLRQGDILVGKVSPVVLLELTPEQKLLHALFGGAGSAP
jgi:DNA-directed RNA polymerase subunit beta